MPAQLQASGDDSSLDPQLAYKAKGRKNGISLGTQIYGHGICRSAIHPPESIRIFGSDPSFAYTDRPWLPCCHVLIHFPESPPSHRQSERRCNG